MICSNCQAEVQDLPFCPHCGHQLGDKTSHLQDPSLARRTRRRRLVRRWILPVLLLLVVIAFGILGLSLLGFKDGLAERALATQHQAEIHYNRGKIYLACRQYQLAEAEFEEALRLVPNYRVAEQERRVAQIKQTPTPSPAPPLATPTRPVPTPTQVVVVIPKAEVLFEDSQVSYNNQEWEQAISQLEQLRAEDTTYRSEDVIEMLFQSHKNYGIELDEQDNLEEAITHYDSALYLHRRDPEVEERRLRADLYLKALGVWHVDWETAIMNLTSLYARAPDYKDTGERLYEACVSYAPAFVKQERYCVAAELYEQAIEIRDDDPEVVEWERKTDILCQKVTPVPLETPTPDGSTPAQVHLGTLVASCYDYRADRYDICAQNAVTNVLQTWITRAEQPAVTLDGSVLAYRSTDPENPGLYAMDILSGTVVTITTEPEAAYPTWSPQGTQVAYAQYDPEQEDWFIYIAQVGGDQEPRRVRRGQWPSWGPNGLLALTTCDEENDCGIHVLNPATRELRRLTGSAQDRAAAWSPSGDEIAYMSDIGLSFNLYIVHAGSGYVRQITMNLFKDSMPIWSPDGQRIAFVTNRDDDWSIYTTHPYPSGKEERRIADLGVESADWLRFQLAWVAPIVSLPPGP